MSFNLDEIILDQDLSVDGVWVDFYNGSRLKIASSDNPKYKAALSKLARQHRLQLDDANDESSELIQDITADAMSKHVLLDWEKVSVGGDEDAPYSPELGKKALRAAPKLRDFVTDQASSSAIFKKKVVEEVKKSSTGNSLGEAASTL